MNTTSTSRRPLSLVALLVLVVLALAACTGASSPSASGAVGSPPASGPAGSSTLPVSPGSSGKPTVDAAQAAFDAVRARSPWFDGLKAKDPNLVGQGSWWTAVPSADGGWAVTVEVGWGDCQAGCIDRHDWQWQVAKDGAVTFESQSGPALPEAQRVALAGASSTTGIGGEVTAGPTCPVERPGDSACAERAVGGAVLVVQDSGGADVARFTTDPSGLFRIELQPGAYTLSTQPVARIMRSAPTQQVTVTAGKLSLVTVSYDTGIR